MRTKYAKPILLTLSLLLIIWVIWYANGVFLIAFSAILLAIFLNAVGRGAHRITKLPYLAALFLAVIVILGVLTLTFWLYSPLIAEQFDLLMKELPTAAENLRKALTPFFGPDFLTQEKIKQEFTLSNQRIFTQLITVFSTTVGTIAGFIVFLIVGLYLAVDPNRYFNWILFLIPQKNQAKVSQIMEKMGQSLRWWLLGKLFSMAFVGLTTFVGLLLLHVNLAFILGFLAALLTFIPYVGAILASIPAILIGFAQSPLTAVYVTALYVGIHLLDGYLITPYIEQRTVSIPPAFSIMAQMLMVVLVGGIGLALATPLAVVALALIHYSANQKASLKVAKQSHYTDDN